MMRSIYRHLSAMAIFLTLSSKSSFKRGYLEPSTSISNWIEILSRHTSHHHHHNLPIFVISILVKWKRDLTARGISKLTHTILPWKICPIHLLAQYNSTYTTKSRRLNKVTQSLASKSTLKNQNSVEKQDLSKLEQLPPTSGKILRLILAQASCSLSLPVIERKTKP